LLGVGQGRLHSKGGTAAKSRHFEEGIQGWPLISCSAFSVAPWSRSQMPFAFFPFFLDQLFLVSIVFLWASHAGVWRSQSCIIKYPFGNITKNAVQSSLGDGLHFLFSFYHPFYISTKVVSIVCISHTEEKVFVLLFHSKRA